MIVEERIYTFRIGGAGEFLRLYEERGLELQRRILGRMVGYFTTEFGTLHQIVHMWAYRDLAERAERRALLAAEPAWQEFQKDTAGLIVKQENRLLMPTRFSPWFEDEA